MNRSAIMKLSVKSRALDAVRVLKAHVRSNQYWTTKLAELDSPRLKGDGAARVHVAVFVEPYLSFVLDGTKTVESRFSINRCAPFEKVSIGDILLIKRSGGGVVAICEVTCTWYYHLDATAWKVIKNRFAPALAIRDNAFWKSRERACFASLFQINQVHNFDSLPFEKRDRRGWVVLPERENQTVLFSA